MKEYAFGVDLGGTTVKIGFFRTDGKLLEKWEIKTNTAEGGVHILPDIAASIKERLAEDGISPDEVLGVGIGVPGPVNGKGVVNGCVNLGWGEVNVQEELSGLLDGLTVKAGNDANVAAMGEAWQGAGQGCRDMVMVTLGTGVGGGVIADGHIVTGHHGAGGEIGHITVNEAETEKCNCGKCGCLEQYASATGIARLAQKALKETDMASCLRDAETVTAKEVFDGAKAGDELALKVAGEACEKLGAALASVSAVTDPEMIVIGGGVSKAGDILVDMVHQAYLKNCFHASRAVFFSLAELENDAGIYGGVGMLL